MSNDDSKKNDINYYFYSADVRFLVAMGPATPPASSSHIGGNFHHLVKKKRHDNITTITDIQAMQYLHAESALQTLLSPNGVLLERQFFNFPMSTPMQLQ